MLLRCGEQYRRRYIQGEKIPPPGRVIRGRCGHEATAYNFVQKVSSRQDLSEDAVLTAFVDAWDSAKYEIAWAPEELDGESPKKAEGRMKDSGIKLVSLYHKEQSPQVQPTVVETSFEVEFYGDFPKLVGVVDRITEEGSVEEDKFVGKTPPEDDALGDIQLTCYQLGYQMKYGEPPTKLRKRFAVDLKMPKTVIREAPPREQTQIDRFLFRLELAMKAIRQSIFLPASNDAWVCAPKWCGYYQTCKVRP